ncbi:MAG TPA: hypothetical protein ENK23_00385 [Sorangium sp.]|nr:hypothetical protein [Sorangium sp.]
MFQDVLKEVVERADGAVASLVMDTDGITMDSFTTPGAKYDILTVGIELSVVVKGVAQAATMLEAGEAQELTVVTDDLTTVVRMICGNYFLALSLKPGANVGKARYLLRTRAPDLVDDLS